MQDSQNLKKRLELRAMLEKLFISEHSNEKEIAIESFKEAILLDPEIKTRTLDILEKDTNFLKNIRNEPQFLELLQIEND